jgi:hypothetical protein
MSLGASTLLAPRSQLRSLIKDLIQEETYGENDPQSTGQAPADDAGG